MIEADLADERYDAPEGPGLDVILRGLSMTCSDEQVIALAEPIFDGLYEYQCRAVQLNRPPHLMPSPPRLPATSSRSGGPYAPGSASPRSILI